MAAWPFRPKMAFPAKTGIRARRFTAVAALALALAGLAAAPALGASKWVVKGAGYGHGIGLSQYGAYGFAKNGFDYSAILGHYYSGTTIGTTQTQTVRVLLSSARSIRFSGANSASGRCAIS